MRLSSYCYRNINGCFPCVVGGRPSATDSNSSGLNPSPQLYLLRDMGTKNCFRTAYEGVSKSFRTELSITKYTLTFGITHWEATRRVMAAKLTRPTHKIVIQLRLVAQSCTICSSRSRRPVRKLLVTPPYLMMLVSDTKQLWPNFKH
jgi:hypothetical protein